MKVQPRRAQPLRLPSIKTSHLGHGSLVLRTTILLNLILGCILGYWASATSQQEELPNVQTEWIVTTLATDGSTGAEVLAELDDAAKQSGGSLYVEVPEPSGRVVYGAGKQPEHWITHCYQGLPGTPHLTVRPLSELPHQDYRQALEMVGGHGLKDAVLGVLEQHGIEHQPLYSQQWVFLLSGTALGSLTGLLIGITFSLTVIAGILNSRNDAIRRLHGFTVTRSCAYDLRIACGRAGLLTAGALGLATLLPIFAVSSPAATQWIFYQLVFDVVGLLVSALSLFGTFVLLRLSPVRAIIAGKLPRTATSVAILAARTVTCLVVASLAIGVTNYSAEWARQSKEAASWAHAPTAYGLTFNGARDLETLQPTEKELADSLRQLSTKHDLLLAQYIDAPMIRGANLASDVMVFNETAAESSLSGPALEALHAANIAGQPLWLQPETVSPADGIERAQDVVAQDAHWAEETYSPGESTAFSWEAGDSEWMNRSQIDDPIIAVFPDDELPVADHSLVALATNQDVLLKNYDDFLQLQTDPEFGSFVRSASPMSQQWAANHQRMGSEAWVYAGAFVAAGIICVTVAIAAAFTTLRNFHQKLRASLIHGVTPWTIIAGVGAAECFTIACTALYLWNKGELARRWTMDSQWIGAADPSMIAMNSVPPLAWVATLFTVINATCISIGVMRSNHSLSHLVQARR